MPTMEEKIITLIFSYKVTGYEIHKHTGLDQSVISKLRKGQRAVDNLTIKTGRKLEKCFDDFERENMLSFKRDFKEAMNEFKIAQRDNELNSAH